MPDQDVGGRRVGGLVVEQQVGPAAVRDAVVRPVDAVPGLVLEVRDDVGVVGHQAGVHRLHPVAVDQPQRGVAGRGHHVVLAGGEQLHGLGRGGERLDRDLAAGGLLERGHPVHGGVGGAVLGVPGPGQHRELALAGPDRALVDLVGRRRRRAAARTATGGAAAAPAAAGEGEADRPHQRHRPGRCPSSHLDLLLGPSSGWGVSCSRTSCSGRQDSRTGSPRSGAGRSVAPLSSSAVSWPPASRSTTQRVVGPV